MKDFIVVMVIVAVIMGIIFGLVTLTLEWQKNDCNKLGVTIERTTVFKDGVCYIDYCGALITEDSIKYNEQLIRSCDD